MSSYFDRVEPDSINCLSKAAYFGDVEKLKKLILEGKDDIQDNRGYRVFHYAVLGNQAECIPILDKARQTDANWPAHEGYTPIFLACKLGYYDVLNSLLNCTEIRLDCDNPLGNSLVHISYQNPRIIKRLLEAGLSVNSRNDNLQTPLNFVCCYSGGPKNDDIIETLRILVEAKADLYLPDNTGLIPLHSASMNINFEWGTLSLLSLLKNDEERKKLINTTNHLDGMTSLYLAVYSQSLKLVKEYLRLGMV